MKTFNNELVVHRNETFTIDKSLYNKDGSPYIISSELKNPYFVMSISSTRYDQRNRYIKNYWLDLSKYLRFVSTQPIDILSFKTTPDGTVPKYGDGFPSLTNAQIASQGYLLEGYIGNKLVRYDVGDAIFSYKNDNDITEYKYWSTGSEAWIDYTCKITFPISHKDTKDWIEQSYVYSIQLVSGATVEEYLKTLLRDAGITYTNEDKYGLYKLAIDNDILLPENFSIDKPLLSYDVVKPILAPTKMSVMSNIQGGM